MDPDMTPEERLKAFVSYSDNGSQNWHSRMAPFLKLVSFSAALPHPSVTFSFTVDEIHNNNAGNMHGGAVASLFDWATTMPLAMVAKPGFWSFMGVTRRLDVTYLRPAPIGTECLVEVELVSVGKSMALLKGTMRRKSDGAILAVCQHDKVNTDPPASKI